MKCKIIAIVLIKESRRVTRLYFMDENSTLCYVHPWLPTRFISACRDLKSLSKIFHSPDTELIIDKKKINKLSLIHI